MAEHEHDESCDEPGDGESRSRDHPVEAETHRADYFTIPLDEGELALGDLQTIFFCELFDCPRERKIYVTVRHRGVW